MVVPYHWQSELAQFIDRSKSSGKFSVFDGSRAWRLFFCIFAFIHCKTVPQMDSKAHKAYLQEFKNYSKEISASKETMQNFLVRTGINTPTGRLTKAYSSGSSSSNSGK